MINGMLNTDWLVSMLKKHGPRSLTELRNLRAGPEGDGLSTSLSCAMNELSQDGRAVRRVADGRWVLVDRMGWSEAFALMASGMKNKRNRKKGRMAA